MASVAEAKSAETRPFQAEVSKLLDIVVHSLYSNKEIFLRELISNASDACDRLRYAALTQPELLGGDAALEVRVRPEREARRLVVADNGIGMNHDDLVENLGTIARSGTAAFLKQLTGDARKDMALIGQFGVGFYSAFMVAERVEVVSRKAGEDQVWRWVSDGQGAFTVEEVGAEAAAAQGRGTTITLHLRAGEEEFLEPARLRRIITSYSDHIALPVMLEEGGKATQVNAAAALWMRPKAEITEAQYKEFYRHAAHAFDEPWAVLHWRAEGTIEYAALLFVPSLRPFDLFDPARRQRVKLYVRRVFITDSCEELLPVWLRFLRGVVDSEDLPLNVSREMLQHNPVLAKIRAGLTKRALAELKARAEKDAADYAKFWENFGTVLKEGLYEGGEEHREALLDLCRFRSTAAEGLVGLADYVGRMKPGQEAIYTIAGDDAQALSRSPHLEGFRARGVEVLLLTDPIDEFWPGRVERYRDKPFKSVTRGAADLDKIAGAAADKAEGEPDKAAADALILAFKMALGDAVRDVRRSQRLTDSAVCLVADEQDLDIHLERLLRQHRQLDKASPRILEINPKHPLIRRLSGLAAQTGGDRGLIADAAHLLLDQARLMEGEVPADPAAFARRLASVIERGLPEAG